MITFRRVLKKRWISSTCFFVIFKVNMNLATPPFQDFYIFEVFGIRKLRGDNPTRFISGWLNHQLVFLNQDTAKH